MESQKTNRENSSVCLPGNSGEQSLERHGGRPLEKPGIQLVFSDSNATFQDWIRSVNHERDCPYTLVTLSTPSSAATLLANQPCAKKLDDLITQAVNALAAQVLASYPYLRFHQLSEHGIRSSEPDRSTNGRLSRFSSQLWQKTALSLCQSGKLPLVDGLTSAEHVSRLLQLLTDDAPLLICNAHQPGLTADQLPQWTAFGRWLSALSPHLVLMSVPTRFKNHVALESIAYRAFELDRRELYFDEPDIDHQTEIDEEGIPVPHSRDLPPNITTPRIDNRDNRADNLEPFQKPATRNNPASPDVSVYPIIGRPHPDSPAEQKLAALLEQDSLLAGLFHFNQRVQVTRVTRTPRHLIVDLLWPEARLIIEIDGYRYHSSRAMFGSDRQRDFELLIEGYQVVRLTHQEVMEQQAQTLNKLHHLYRAFHHALQKPQSQNLLKENQK